MIKAIDHIAIKVDDLQQVSSALEVLGIPAPKVKQFDEVGMKIAFMKIGEICLELLKVTDDSSPIADDPSGMHHIGIKTQDIEATYGMMARDKQFEIQGKIQKGAHARIFFFRISGHEKILFECVEEKGK